MRLRFGARVAEFDDVFAGGERNSQKETVGPQGVFRLPVDDRAPRLVINLIRRKNDFFGVSCLANDPPRLADDDLCVSRGRDNGSRRMRIISQENAFLAQRSGCSQSSDALSAFSQRAGRRPMPKRPRARKRVAQLLIADGADA